MAIALSSFIVLFLNLGTAIAHPTSFEGGYTLMTEMSSVKSETSLVYSPRWYWGLGVNFEQMNDQVRLTSTQFSWLVKRWNLDHAQGNIYLYGGPGYADFLQTDTSGFGSGGFYRLGFQADYETRKFYTMVRVHENRLFENNERILSQVDLRVGFAPYIANYNELNSWIILNLRTMNDFEDVAVIPTLRFYFNNFLWEIAQDFDGVSYLTFMTRF